MNSGPFSGCVPAFGSEFRAQAPGPTHRSISPAKSCFFQPATGPFPQPWPCGPCGLGPLNWGLPNGSNIAAGIFPVPSLTPRSGPPNPSLDGSMSTLSSPRKPRLEIPQLSAVLPPPSRASTSSSGRQSPRAEEYLKSMKRVGQAHQQQLRILERHWDLMQDFEKGKLESFKQEHAVLKQKQLHLLKEVEAQLQELGCQSPLQEVTFGEAAPQKLRQKVLVVGATGLLGREIFKTFSSKVEVRGISTSTPVRIPEVVNGPVLEVFEDQFRNFRPHVVLHLSGSEAFENENSLSFQTFLANTRAIAACCEAHGVWLIHLSSPAVFDGQSAPYTVNAEPNPVTDDGIVSLEAEQLALSCPKSAVLRVPRCLYGPVEQLKESPVTGVLDQLRQGQVHFDIQPLYPTFVGDVASLLLLLVEHLMDGELRGIYHWQGPDQLSELQIAKVWCQATGDAVATSLRPRGGPKTDRALEISRVVRSFSVTPTPFMEGMKKCLPHLPFNAAATTAVAGTLHWAGRVGEQVV